jgi:hypothetical protein
MTKDEISPNDETRIAVVFVIGASRVLRHCSFVLRHS